MELIILVLGIIALAYWQNSTSLNLLAGVIAVAFGLYWMQTEGITDFMNIAIGVVSGMIGLHLWIKTAIMFFGGRHE